MWDKENKEEVKEKKMLRKIKNKFKVNKLFVYIFLNSFYLFFFMVQGLDNFKICKISINFNYIWFSFIFFIVKPNKRK